MAQVRNTGMIRILRQGDSGVLVAAALLLLAGWGLRHYYMDRTLQYKGQGITLLYPEGWSSHSSSSTRGQGQQHEEVLSDLLSAGAVKPSIRISSEPLPGELTADNIHSYLLLDRQRQCNLFHLMSQKQLQRGTHRAFWLEYAHAVNPAGNADDPAATDVPAVLRVSSLAIQVGRRLLRVDVEQSVSQHRTDPQLARRVLQSVKVL